ncbi:37S ribosomal protein S16, mitochondrial [Thecaphora frezii]
MVVRLRLARHGTRNNPFYHVVAINDSKPRDARPIEKLGEYDPIPRALPVARPPATPAAAAGKGKAKQAHPPPATAEREGYGKLMTSGLHVETKLQKRIEWNEERIKYWLKTGAQPSKPVARLLYRAGLIPEGVYYKGMPLPAPTTTGSTTKPTPSSAAASHTSPILKAVADAKSPSSNQPSSASRPSSLG